jgi:hypothetical protein
MKMKFLRTRCGNIPAQNKHFIACQYSGKPYVVIFPGRKYASVSLDIIGLQYNLTATAVKAVEKYLKANWSKHNGSAMSAGAIYSFVVVQLEKAEAVAEWLYDFASKSENQKALR